MITNTSRVSLLSESFIGTYLTCISKLLFISINLFTTWSVLTTSNRWKYFWYINLLSFNCLNHIHRIEIWLSVATIEICKTVCHLMRCSSNILLFICWLCWSWLVDLNILLNLVLKLLLLELVELLYVLNYLFFLVWANWFHTIA
jgi:hypothetical protein